MRYVAESKDGEILLNASYKIEQLSDTCYKFREFCTKLHSIRLRYKTGRTATSPSNDHNADCMVKLQKLALPKFSGVLRDLIQ